MGLQRRLKSSHEEKTILEVASSCQDRQFYEVSPVIKNELKITDLAIDDLPAVTLYAINHCYTCIEAKMISNCQSGERKKNPYSEDNIVTQSDNLGKQN
ncbi:hypothetical protein V6N11_014807 [Hibiscus sabdariffa]|uniref:Uncharacterized protein n=1 Tax=Hibiscus sabdariffa TaxID=183260 RepID=A0ABR2TQ68_9ROSI